MNALIAHLSIVMTLVFICDHHLSHIYIIVFISLIFYIHHKIQFSFKNLDRTTIIGYQGIHSLSKIFLIKGLWK